MFNTIKTESYKENNTPAPNTNNSQQVLLWCGWWQIPIATTPKLYKWLREWVNEWMNKKVNTHTTIEACNMFDENVVKKQTNKQSVGWLVGLWRRQREQGCVLFFSKRTQVPCGQWSFLIKSLSKANKNSNKQNVPTQKSINQDTQSKPKNTETESNQIKNVT